MVCKFYHIPPSQLFDVISVDEYYFTALGISHENKVKYGR